MNIERDTDEFMIRRMSENVYMKFDKSDARCQQNADEIKSVFKAIESTNAQSDEEDNPKQKYVFVRLYDPVYKGITAANLLKRGVAATEVNKINSSHAAIGVTLKDRFYGLTGLKGKDEHDFAIEQVTNLSSNSYMAGCDPQKSTCRVYAYPVDDQEYSKIKSSINKYIRNNTLSYDTIHNFVIAISSIKRKFFTKKSKQLIGREAADIISFEDARQEVEKVPTRFVCSTFVAYLMYTCIKRIHNWFDNHNVNYSRVTPSDLSAVRGMRYCFYTKWCDYNTTVQKFVEKHPEFKEFL